MELFFIADVIGLIASSITGFLVAVRKNLDILGVFIASFSSALGGGLLRDSIVTNTPFAFSHTYPSLSVLIGIMIAFAFKLHKKGAIERKILFVTIDALGLVAFSIAGALIGIEHNFNFFGVIFLGFITAVGGGIIRDVLINEIPTILVSEFYGVVAIFASMLLFLLNYFSFLNFFTTLLVAILCVLIRLIAFFKSWNLPKL